jgi:ribosomal protein S18 acetylase RimI-like enzyme
MGIPDVRAAMPEERVRVLQIMVLAFAGDPTFRWMFPDPNEYLEKFAGFVDADVGQSLDFGTTYVAEQAGAAAMWFRPGQTADPERSPTYLQQCLSPTLFEAAGELVTQFDQFKPKEPHWYLGVIGVDTRHHGEGLGSTLMKHVLQQIDADASPAFLFSSNLRNRPFYERHGFEIVSEIQAGSSPVVTPMIRAPRT